MLHLVMSSVTIILNKLTVTEEGREKKLYNTSAFVPSNFCHHDSGGAAVDSPPSQPDPYLSHCKGLKLFASSVQEL
jgi:hypothetical protein